MKKLLAITAFLGGIGVILGALGAHALKHQLDSEQLKSFQTGVLYQMIHVLAILAIAGTSFLNEQKKKIIINIFLLGIFLFSGSIYLIYLANIPAKSIWFVTPLGGISFMLGWFLLSYYFIQNKK